MNTRAALVEYDAGERARDELWEIADSNEAVALAQESDKNALDKVRRAFLKDTKAINHWSSVQYVDLPFMRRMAARPEA